MSTVAARLSCVWFLYFGGLGILFPFFSLYLRESAGLTATEVGTVVTMSPIVALFAPTLWGRFADRTRSRVRVVGTAIAGASCATVGLSLLDGYRALLVGSVALAAFSTAIVPLLVSVTLAALGEDALRRFGSIRVWGTLGFLVVVVGFPPVLHRYQALRGIAPVPGIVGEPGLAVMFLVAAAWMLASLLVLARVPEPPEPPHVRSGEMNWTLLSRHRPFVAILGFSFAAFFFIQGPMSMFPLYVRSRGGGLDTLSDMWIFMLLLEVPLIALSGAGLRRLGPRGLVAIGLAAGGVRWVVCALTQDMTTIYALQLLHGVTVAGLSVGSSLYVEASVPPHLRATAQGLASMAGAGAGAILSNVIAGWMIDHIGIDAPFLAGGAGTLLLTALVPALLPEPRKPEA